MRQFLEKVRAQLMIHRAALCELERSLQITRRLAMGMAHACIGTRRAKKRDCLWIDLSRIRAHEMIRQLARMGERLWAVILLHALCYTGVQHARPCLSELAVNSFTQQRM